MDVLAHDGCPVTLRQELHVHVRQLLDAHGPIGDELRNELVEELPCTVLQHVGVHLDLGDVL